MGVPIVPSLHLSDDLFQFVITGLRLVLETREAAQQRGVVSKGDKWMQPGPPNGKHDRKMLLVAGMMI
jgi:hypothetical protein